MARSMEMLFWENPKDENTLSQIGEPEYKPYPFFAENKNIRNLYQAMKIRHNWEFLLKSLIFFRREQRFVVNKIVLEIKYPQNYTN